MFYYNESKIEVAIVSVSIPFTLKLFIFIVCNKNFNIRWSTYPKTMTSVLFYYQIYVAILWRLAVMNTSTECIRMKRVQCAIHQLLIGELYITELRHDSLNFTRRKDKMRRDSSSNLFCRYWDYFLSNLYRRIVFIFGKYFSEIMIKDRTSWT